MSKSFSPMTKSAKRIFQLLHLFKVTHSVRWQAPNWCTALCYCLHRTSNVFLSPGYQSLPIHICNLGNSLRFTLRTQTVLLPSNVFQPLICTQTLLLLSNLFQPFVCTQTVLLLSNVFQPLICTQTVLLLSKVFQPFICTQTILLSNVFQPFICTQIVLLLSNMFQPFIW